MTERKSIDDATPEEWTRASATLHDEKILKHSWVKNAENRYNSTVKRFDEVEKPQHYNAGKYETIDIIIDTLGEYDAINYCHGNVLKYVIRMWHKGHPVKDAQKAQWYLNKMIELLEKTKGVNW
jgi:hypothetical protein